MKHVRRLLALIAVSAVTALTGPPAASDGPLSLPMHGNWCGPGHTAGTPMTGSAPVDPLDAACMRHDLCYVQRGTADCGCDIAFMDELRHSRYPNPELYTRARAMYDAIAMTPCKSAGGMVEKQSRVWGDMARDVFSGRSSPLDIPMRWMHLGGRTLENKRSLGQ